MLSMVHYEQINEWFTSCPLCSAGFSFFNYTVGRCYRCKQDIPKFEKLPKEIKERIKFHKEWGERTKEFKEKCSI